MPLFIIFQFMPVKGPVIIYTQGWGRREMILTAKNSPTQPNLDQKFGLPHHF